MTLDSKFQGLTAFQQMLTAMNHGGNIALLGIPPNDTASIGTMSFSWD